MRHDLRIRLAPMHDTLDRAVATRCFHRGFDLAALLCVHAAALPPVVAALDAAGAARCFPGWDGAERVGVLRADLRRLGQAEPPPVPQPRIAGPAALAGGLYALEGSRLGNRVLLRRALAEGDARERGATAFLAHGAAGAWPRFVAWLDAQGPALDQDDAARGAEAVFAAYLAAVAAPAPVEG